ncbi:equilibrative nucleoside transporter 4-like [Centruroides sculpturatus]|uniref:equilibrative nucleoside transporter 4-like n=1 Tax=Centruroides sculpturatus TaxID=218467 RepID=UPI000C6D9B76|nr:equilibrative nucleoside transporter 4-like [Centruroides sculpturatus]
MDENLSRGYIQLGQGSRADRITRGLSYEHSHPPEDRCHCIYFALLLAGVGFLLPYNSFIIAVDYFQARYPGTTIVFDMSLIYILVAFAAVIINNLFVETLTLQVRITFGYILSFVTLLFIAVFEIWFEIFTLDTGYYINLLGVAVVAFGCTVQQSSFYGYTSMLPSRYTQSVMTGESAAGLLISTNRILTKALLDDEKVNTVLFFCISIGIVILCFIIHFVLQKTKFVRFYISLCSNASLSDDLSKRISLEPTEDVGLVDMLDPVESKSGKYGVLSLRTPPSSPPADSAFESTEKLDQDVNEEADLWRMSTESVFNSFAANSKTYRVQDVVVRMRGINYTKNIQMWSGIKRGVIVRWQVAKCVWPYMLCIALAYFVTLCLFPGIESEIVSCRLRSWMPVILMAIFNFFDFIGKILASIPYDWTKAKLVLFSSVRIVLVPLLAMCAAPRGDPLLKNEEWAMVLSLFLGLSNGVFGSVPMIVAPSMVPDEQKELTGNIMTLSYTLGLTTGSGVAYLIDYILGPPLKNPCSSTTPSITQLTSTLASLNVTDFAHVSTTWPWNVSGIIELGSQNSTLF